MIVTDEMIAAARRVFHADVDPFGWVDDDEIRAALEAALSVAPPSDDYRRGLEDAEVLCRAQAERLYDHAKAPYLECADAIRRLGGSK